MTKQVAKTLYIKVETYDGAGKQIGERVVDMYHFGTRNWLQTHQWWAMHNSHTIELRPADDGEVQAYLDEAKLKLAEKFNREHQPVAA